MTAEKMKQTGFEKERSAEVKCSKSTWQNVNHTFKVLHVTATSGCDDTVSKF